MTVDRFDEQVNVIALERVVDEAELLTLAAAGEAAFDHLNETNAAQRRHSLPDSEGHVTREAPCNAFARAMSNPRIRSRSSSTPVPSLSPPSIELELSGVSSHKCVC